MTTKQRNDNKEQERANFYKVLVAIEYALSLSEYEKIILEHKGDVTFDNKIQIEVKHVQGNITNKSKEFWNTFYNWISDPDSFKFEQFILYTTQKAGARSIFTSWGKNTETDYFKLKQTYKDSELSSIKKDSSKYYFNKIFKQSLYKEEDIKCALKKIKIEHSRPIDTDLISEIANKYYYQSIPKDQDRFVRKCLGGTIYSHVEGLGRWELSREEFYQVSHNQLQNFLKEPKFEVYEEYMDKELEEEKIKTFYDKDFVKKLQCLNCEEYNVHEAITDYWRTTSMIIELQDINRTFIKNEYRKYQNEKVYKKLKNEKDILDPIDDINANKKQSLKFYKKAKIWSPMKFKSIPELEYIHHGTLNRIAEDPDNEGFNFNWLIE